MAEETINQLTSAVNAGTSKKIFRDYRTAIERYFIPFFGSRHLERIDHRAVSEFEQWRNQQMGRAPAHSGKTGARWMRSWQHACPCVYSASARASSPTNLRGVLKIVDYIRNVAR